YARPHLGITLRPRLEWQRNSLAATPYFNPIEGWLPSIEAEVEHILWRAYERAFVHRLRLNVGAYEQRGFGTNAVGSAAYEQGWRHDPWTELTWGLEWASRVYDGQRERTLRAYLVLQHKFGR
ncbi:MAG: hypothetical protein ABWZ88_09685, partial [Variovorax sp.]